MTSYPIYNYTECNNFAISQMQNLDELYKAVFNDLMEIEIISDQERQLAGIDKILHFENREINIDEKIERNNTDNLVFEDSTDIRTGKAGWLKEDAKTDYVVYYKTTGKRVFVVPFKALMAMYKDYRDIWIDSPYERFVANKRSKGYATARIFVVPYTEVQEYMEEHGFNSEFEILYNLAEGKS